MATWISDKRELSEEIRRSNVVSSITAAYGGLFTAPLGAFLIPLELPHRQTLESYGALIIAGATGVLGKPEGVPGYHDLKRYPEASQTPGLLMIRWDAPIFFANANLFRKRLLDLIAQTDPAPFWVVVAAEPITDVDTTAAEMLVDLDEELNATGIHLIFAELKDPVRDKIERYGLYDTIDRRHFYRTIEAAVEEFYLEKQIRDQEQART